MMIGKGAARFMRVPDMFLFEEKRKLKDRRVADTGAPAGCRERRVEADRRQTKISEISFSEWASHLVEFRKHATARDAVSKAGNSPEVARTTGVSRSFSSSSSPFPNR
ncbi:MAG: hypothetical protein QMB52_00915 [Propionivibrio sp.]